MQNLGIKFPILENNHELYEFITNYSTNDDYQRDYSKFVFNENGEFKHLIPSHINGKIAEPIIREALGIHEKYAKYVVPNITESKQLEFNKKVFNIVFDDSIPEEEKTA